MNKSVKARLPYSYLFHCNVIPNDVNPVDSASDLHDGHLIQISGIPDSSSL
jgi:hypothetical protein